MDNRKFEEIFKEFYANLSRFAYTYLKSEVASEEVVQELFTSLWEQGVDLQDKISVRSYLYTSVKNRSLNYIRDHKTRAFHEDEVASINSGSIDHIINYAENEEIKQQLDKSISYLPEQCRKIFILSRIENLSYNEIAQKLSISNKTVERQINIALKKIRGNFVGLRSFFIFISF